jgi:hypothetical protein
MFKKVSCVLMAALIVSTSMVIAGGPVGGVPCPAPVYCAPKACGPAPGYGPGPGAGSGSPAYWGDAPFPGMCGGVVALPFLVVGSLLGGNTSAPPAYGPGMPQGMPQGSYQCAPPAPSYQCAPPVSYQCAPPVAYQCAPPAPSYQCGPIAPPYQGYPPVQAPVRGCPPPAPQACGAGYQQGGGGILSGLPCIDLCAGLLGNFTGGMNPLY